MTDLSDPANKDILFRIRRGEYIEGDLKTVLYFDNYVDAHIVKGLFEYFGVFTFLENEDYGMNKYSAESPSDGVISLKIHERDFALAKEALLAEIDSDSPFYDDLLKRTACPHCQSKDYSITNLSYYLACVFLIFFNTPLPFKKNLLKCHQCKRLWQLT